MALALGRSDPWALADELGPQLLAEWQEYYYVEPLSQPYVQAAFLAQQLAQQSAVYLTARGAKKVNWPKFDDYTLDPTAKRSEERTQSPREMMGVAQTIAAAAGAKRGSN